MNPPDELVAAILADPTDPGPIAVYADWLQGQGDPCGAMIVARQLGKRDVDADSADFATFGWRAGLWQWARLENAADWSDPRFDPFATYDPMFASPLAIALDELRIGVLSWEHNHREVPIVLLAAGLHPWAKRLRRLKLGDIDRDVDLGHHSIGDVGQVIADNFPALRSLCLHSSEQTMYGARTFELGGLALPLLDTLAIETCSMTASRFAQLGTCTLPALTALDVWFGATERDPDAPLPDLQPLLAGRWFPGLTRLGIMNIDTTDEVAAALATSAIAPRLVELDLSMGTLGNEGVGALVAARAVYRKLRTLVVSDNFLRAADEAALREAFDGVDVISDGQKLAGQIGAGGAEYRYVSVSE